MSRWTNEHAEQYDQLWGDLPLLSEIPMWLPLYGNERVMDIGCGSGAVLEAIAQQYPDCQLFGCDPMTYMVDKASSRVPEVHIEQADVESYTGADFDLVLAANTVRHWNDVAAGLAHINKQGCQTIVFVDDLAFNPSSDTFCDAINAALAWLEQNNFTVQIEKNSEFDVSIIRAVQDDMITSNNRN